MKKRKSGGQLFPFSSHFFRDCVTIAPKVQTLALPSLKGRVAAVRLTGGFLPVCGAKNVCESDKRVPVSGGKGGGKAVGRVLRIEKAPLGVLSLLLTTYSLLLTWQATRAREHRSVMSYTMYRREGVLSSTRSTFHSPVQQPADGRVRR